MKRAALILALIAAPAFANDAKLWPINEATHEIPVQRDERTGHIDRTAQTIIELANTSYDEGDRRQIIDFCRGRALDKLGARSTARTPGLMTQLREEFQRCAVGMIRQWEAEAKK